MKTHLVWIRVTATAAIVAGVGAYPAAAQYAPYQPVPQQPVAQPAVPPIAQAPVQAAVPSVVQPTAQRAVQPPVSAQQYATHQPVAPQPVAQQPVAQQAVTPRIAQSTAAPTAQTPYVVWQTSQAIASQQQAAAAYQPTVAPYQPAPPATGGYPQTTAPYVPYVATNAPYSPAPAPAPTAAGYPSGYPAYPAVANRQNDEESTLPAPTSPVDVQPNGAANGQAVSGEYNNGGNGYPAGYPTVNDCDCNQPAHSGYGITSYFDNPCHDSQWFGGVYFLFMERDNATPQKLTVEVDHSVATDPYYPLAHTSVLGTHFVDHDYRPGGEVRIGSTFTISDGCDTCNTGCYGGCNGCAPCAADVYAWEVAWWGIDDDVETYTFTEVAAAYPRRIYGMKNFAGLEYGRTGPGGFAYRPVNDYYAYQLPIPDPGAGPYADGYIAVLAQHIRTNFKAQNLELNIFRFPVCQMSSGCNSGCYGNECGCEEQCCPSLFSAYGSCGVRYFRVDDDFMYANEFAEWAGGAPDMPAHDGFYDGTSNELYYDVQVENFLVGPQVGWTMNYNYACKWNFFLNSTFGVFNNHIEQVQRMWGGGDGDVRFAQTGEGFDVESDKNDISFLGELRLGGSYDLSCNWRAVLAYRAIAIAGVATSTDQIPDDFTNPEWVALIDSDNSMIIHGVQIGAECRY